VWWREEAQQTWQEPHLFDEEARELGASVEAETPPDRGLDREERLECV
jgi:hypothetical protein